jgi:TonB family protein
MSPLLTLIACAAATMSVIQGGQDVASPFGSWPRVPPQSLRTEAELHAVLESKPSDLAPYLELAYLYYKAKRTEEAEQVLRRALPVHSQTGAVYGAMVMLYGAPERFDQPEKLEKIAEEWVRADPTNPKPLFVLGRVHLSRAIEARGQLADALMHLDRAKQVADEAVRLSPDDLTTHMLRAAIAKQRLDRTEDPAERARLQQEIKVATQELRRTAKTGDVSTTTQTAWEAQQSQSAVPDSPLRAKAIRVGGNIQPPRKITDVKPVYPPDALQARVQGVAIIEIVIDETGKVAEAIVLRSPPLLGPAADAAVRQWEFAPTLLNGNPVPVIMIATVQFILPEPR